MNPVIELNNDNVLIQELIQSNKQLVNMVKQLSDKIDKLELSNKVILSKINPSKLTTGFNEPLVTLGPRLQKIHPITLELVKVYESVSELMKETQI